MKDIEILEEFAKEYKDTGYFGIIKAEQIREDKRVGSYK